MSYTPQHPSYKWIRFIDISTIAMDMTTELRIAKYTVLVPVLFPKIWMGLNQKLWSDVRNGNGKHDWLFSIYEGSCGIWDRNVRVSSSLQSWKQALLYLDPAKRNSPYNHFQPLTTQLRITFNNWQASLQPLSTTDKPTYNHFQPWWNHDRTCTTMVISWLYLHNHGDIMIVPAQPWWNPCQPIRSQYW